MSYTAEESSSMDAHFKIQAAKTAERLARLCKMLALYIGMTHRGYMNGQALVEYSPKGKGYEGELFIICDNGGEWNVCKINHAWDGRSVAYTAWGFELNTCDQAQRVAQYIRGEQIDYDTRESADMLETLFEIAGIPSRPSWQQITA